MDIWELNLLRPETNLPLGVWKKKNEEIVPVRKLVFFHFQMKREQRNAKQVT